MDQASRLAEDVDVAGEAMNKSGKAEDGEKGKEESWFGVKEKRDKERDRLEGVIRRGRAEEVAGTREP